LHPSDSIEEEETESNDSTNSSGQAV